MHFMHVVFGVVCFFMINIQIVGSEATDAAAEESQQISTTDANEDTTPEDKHTFVALIDIVFTDGSKKSCTGAVIHNNVVLTAAHCFVDRNAETLLPELTLSFVVIGTKKMFEAAYEQYLPIERVISHPKFKGWTADLALVYTFAGMTSDKPGQIIPLAGANTQTPVDSNVTVLSWGRCGDEDDDDGKKRERTNTDSDEDVRKRTNTRRQPATTTVDPFDIGSEAVDGDYYVQAGFKTSYAKNINRKNKPKSGLESFKNWRRQMGSQKNELTVEVFGFVNVQACKKIVERTMPSVFSIKNVHEILCYSSEDRYITNDDSGAPALHNGNLVAVTVGGVETDGDNVAIGMKMSCFCPWIAQNLPNGDGKNLHCCHNCCDNKQSDSDKNDHDDDDSTYKKYIRNGKKSKQIVRFDDGNAQEMFDKHLREGYVKMPQTRFPPGYLASYPPMVPKFKSHPQPHPEYLGPSNSSFRSWYYV